MKIVLALGDNLSAHTLLKDRVCVAAKEFIKYPNDERQDELGAAVLALHEATLPPDPVTELQSAWLAWNGAHGSVREGSKAYARLEAAVSALVAKEAGGE